MASQTTSKSKKSSNRNNKSGFTLVEVLIVLVIVGTVFTIGALANVNLLTRATAETEENTLISTLSRARSRAMNNIQMSKHAVHISEGADYYVIYRKFPYNQSEPTNEKIWREKIIKIENGGLIINGTGDVIFEQLSGNTSTTGNITLKDATSKTKTVTILENGLIDW